MTLAQLLERRANAMLQQREVIDRAEQRGDGFTAEERQTLDRLDAQLDADEGDIGRLERAASRTTGSGLELPPGVAGGELRDGTARGGDGEALDVRYARAFESWVRSAGGMADLEVEERQLLRGQGVDGKELRALGVSTTTAGGFIAPQGFRNQLIEQTKAFGGMLEAAQVLETTDGTVLPWPTVDDTANVGAILAENTQVTQQDVNFGTAQLGAYTYTSKLILVSLQLLQDAAVDVEGLITRSLGNRIGRVWNQHFTTGTGTNQPQGIVTGTAAGAVGATGQTTTVTFDNLIDLELSVDPSYRANATYMIADNGLRALRKIKDTTGQYLWQPSVQAGIPSAFMGRTYRVNNDLPVMAPNAKSILFGDFQQAYVIRIARNVQLIRLNERYADFLQVGFLAFARADAVVQNASAVKAYQNSAT